MSEAKVSEPHALASRDGDGAQHVTEVKASERVLLGVAAVLAAAGAMKVGGAQVMKQSFEEWGYSDEFRLAIGASELVASGLIVARQWRPATLIMSVLMTGAAATHLRTPEQRMLTPGPLIFLAVYLAAVRRLESTT